MVSLIESLPNHKMWLIIIPKSEPNSGSVREWDIHRSFQYNNQTINSVGIMTVTEKIMQTIHIYANRV